MKTSIRTFAGIMAAAMLTASLSACGQSPDTTTTNTQAVTDNTETEKTSEPQNEDAHVYIEGTKFMVGGKELWISGGNTPWYDWNDFTGKMKEDKWEQTFSMLEEDHINCTRIWINCNGDKIVNIDQDGHVTGVNEGHWEDLDKLFDMAEKHKVYIMATLLSFDHFKEEKWQKFLVSKEECDNYAETYVKTFCERYGGCDYLFSIDLMNEPDWVYENDECGKIDWDNISYLFGKCADVIHSTCSTLVTVGTGIIKYNSEKYEGNKVSDEYLKKLTGLDGAYLDFYSVHYYDWQRPWFGFPFDISPEEFGLVYDRPCIIGEAQNDNEKKFRMTLTEIYKSMYDKGWNGLLVWMEPRKDEEQIWYRYDLTKEAVNAMYEYIPEKIDPLSAWKTAA